MPHETLETLYTRALRLLGVSTPGGKQLTSPLSVQPVQIVADVADVSIPHSNPIFGLAMGVAAFAAEFGIAEIRAIDRLVRIRQIFISAGTNVRTFVVAGNYNITRVTDTRFGTPLGPRTDAGTAVVRRGTSTVDPTAFLGVEFEQVQFDVRPPFLIAPGFSLCFGDVVANSGTGISVLWEEIPGQGEVAAIGFPTIA